MKEKINQNIISTQNQVLETRTGNFNINRRRFLKMFGIASLATLASSCISIEVKINPGKDEEDATSTSTVESTNTATAISTNTATATSEINRTATATRNMSVKSTAQREAIETSTKTPTNTKVPTSTKKVVRIKNTETTVPTTVPTEVKQTVPTNATESNNNFAINNNGKWILKDSDGNNVEVSFNAVGFTPSSELKVSPLQEKDLGPLTLDAGDFQAYLNVNRDGFGPLAGYTDGTNDYNQFGDHKSSPQVPVYSWMVHTGLSVDMPGIGKVVGDNGRAVMVLIINRTERVYRFPTESVEVIAGFQGFGRIWNGNENEVVETEKRLVNHYRHRLGNGVAESGFIGQCDKGVNNCDSVTIVTVERVQWGNNDNGTPRDQFRLIRAETVSAK